MNTTDDAIAAGVKQPNALLGWWSIPIASRNGMIDGQLKRLQQFSSDLQKTCSDAYSGEMDALFSSNERLVRSIQDLLRSQRPQEVMVAELNILATFLEGAALQSKRWAELTQKLQQCCAAIARDAAEELHQQARETVSAMGSAEAERISVKQTRTQPAHA